jgi:hypothetical protein
MGERDFHPEWGYLASTRTLVRTLRSLLIAAAVGAVAGSGIALWLVGRAPDDSIAARTLVPSEPEVTAKPSEVTSAKVPSPEQRELRPSAPTQAKAETADMSADRERASPDSSKINPNPSLLQRHIGSAEEHETTPSRNLNVSTARAEGVQRRETSRNSPQRLNHTSALAGSESTAERILDRAQVRAGFERRSTAKRMARKADLSAFFQPWWYAEPARERRRNPG